MRIVEGKIIHFLRLYHSKLTICDKLLEFSTRDKCQNLLHFNRFCTDNITIYQHNKIKNRDFFPSEKVPVLNILVEQIIIFLTFYFD